MTEVIPTPVAIVGAGPSGLLLAPVLAARGIDAGAAGPTENDARFPQEL